MQESCVSLHGQCTVKHRQLSINADFMSLLKADYEEGEYNTSIIPLVRP